MGILGSHLGKIQTFEIGNGAEIANTIQTLFNSSTSKQMKVKSSIGNFGTGFWEKRHFFQWAYDGIKPIKSAKKAQSCINT